MCIAGEASGDQYGARVIREFRRMHPDAEFFGIGGDLMKAEGMELLFHIHETSIMGFIEVAKRLPFIRRMFNRCELMLVKRSPHAVLLIDYPGFNLRFARMVRKRGIKVVYYISPQVWAWGKNRARKMVDLVDHLAVVFPFEKEIFSRIGIPTTFVGHPLLEILQPYDRKAFFDFHSLPDSKPLLALLPGSREQEIRRLLPLMLQSAELVQAHARCSIAIGMSSLPEELYSQYLQGYDNVMLLRDSTHALMQHAHAAIVTSGTATVEIAYYETPMAIVYKAAPINYMIGKHLVNVDFIGMANILAGKQVAPELIQDDATPDAVAEAVVPYFVGRDEREKAIEGLKLVKQNMGTPGASQRVAAILNSEIADRW